MNIKDYEYIVEIADQGSISKAAGRLYITQSALTRFLQRIEFELGIPLFYRHGNKFLLTSAGQLYVEKGRSIIKTNNEVDLELKLMALNSSNYIRLGCGIGRMEQLVGHILPSFYRLHPDFRIKLRTLGSLEMSHMVETNQLDLALLSGVKKTPILSYIPIGNIYAALAVSASSSLLEDTVEEPNYPYPVLRSDRWLDEPYIHIDQRTSSGRIVDAYFKSKGISPKVVLDAENVGIALKAVESGIGNSILLSLPFRSNTVKYCCLPDLDIDTGNFNIAKRCDYFINTAIEDLISIILHYFK